MRLIDANTLKAEFTGNFQNEYTKAEIHALIDLAPTVATDTNVLGKWISVNDRLPELGTPVLFIGKTIYRAWFSTQRGWYDGTFWRRNDGEAVYSTTPVTHWMPLPKPPQEVSGDA